MLKVIRDEAKSCRQAGLQTMAVMLGILDGQMHHRRINCAGAVSRSWAAVQHCMDVLPHSAHCALGRAAQSHACVPYKIQAAACRQHLHTLGAMTSLLYGIKYTALGLLPATPMI